jgi:hypothetical protein
MSEIKQSCIVYPVELEQEIRNNNYIPRKCKPKERLKLYHRYWSSSYGIFKVDDINFIRGVEYYYIKFDSNRMLAVISYPITDNIYELLHDYDKIETKTIINSNKSFTGAEIKFWFVKNKINFADPKYDGFLSFLSINSKNIISDSKFYFVIRDKSKRLKFQVTADKSKL